MSAVASILLGLAAELAVPAVKKILTDAIGGAGGELAGQVVDTVAGKLGVPAGKIPEIAEQEPETVKNALVETEPMAEALVQYVESQRLATELQTTEIGKGPLWTWAWRPAWMWFLGFLWLWRLAVVPALDAAIGSHMAEHIDLSTLAWLTTVFTALYMGGHTVKDFIAARWKGK